MVEKIKKYKFKIIIFLILILSLAGLTRAGYIPNYLDIEILCPNQDSEIIPENNNNLLNQDNINLPIDTNVPVDDSYNIDNNDDISDNNNLDDNFIPSFKKPIIYFYPAKVQNISVKLDYAGEIIADYPKYDKSYGGWKIKAYPNGNLINIEDNKEYSYIFWEGEPDDNINWDFSKGFVIKGEDTRDFLQNTLSKMGLTPKEYNEFIVYWYPIMKNNKYNLITFADKQYTETAALSITPKPDSLLRIFMVFKALNNKIDIDAQILENFERKGFSVIEWGGTEIK